MADNASLGAAKSAKNDEFYTQYSDINAEMNAYVEYNPDVFRNKTILLPCDDPEWSNFTRYFATNFERFGLKKLISTSYAKGAGNRQITIFEMNSPLYDEEKHETRGKLYELTDDTDGNGIIDVDDIKLTCYLEGDGDFRSEEVTKLRDEADIIITNPPFSLFREFLAWIMEGKKQFVIIGNKNAITYKEVFPLLKNNEMWLGPGFPGGNAYFRIAPEDAREFASGVYDEAAGLVKFRNVGWFTNIDHGIRHEELILDTMAHNLKYNKKLKKKLEKDFGISEYPHYDNYDAIEVPFTECIPSDYKPCWFSCGCAEDCEYAQTKGMKKDFEFCAKKELTNNTEYGDNALAARSSQLAARSSQLSATSAQTESAMELWESQSPSSTSITRNSLRLSDLPQEISEDLRELRHEQARMDHISTENCDMAESLFEPKCNGIMGVPITFMDKYNPNQFEIIKFRKGVDDKDLCVNGKYPYFRILIRHKKEGNSK